MAEACEITISATMAMSGAVVFEPEVLMSSMLVSALRAKVATALGQPSSAVQLLNADSLVQDDAPTLAAAQVVDGALLTVSILSPLEFNLLLVGDGGVGKTTFMQRLLTGHFEKRYNATVGVQVLPLLLSTNIGPLTFHVEEIPGGPADAHIVNGCQDAAMIMFDACSRPTFNSVSRYHQDITRACGNIPIVLLGNKVEIMDPLESDIQIHRERGLEYCDISVRSIYNMEKPLLLLARRLASQPDLEFVKDAS